jgi:antitoxin ParD1/3/4
MTSLSKMSVALSEPIAAAVADAVDRGEYRSRSEVVEEALRECTLRRPLNAAAKRAIRRLWEEGVASGPGSSATSAKSSARPVAV